MMMVVVYRHVSSYKRLVTCPLSRLPQPHPSRYIPTLLITCLINRITASLWDMLRKFCDEEKIERKKRPDISIVLGFTFRDAYLCVAR